MAIESRSCGTCTVCCIVYSIDDPALTKAEGSPCVHMVSKGGCAIYERRPSVCRDYYCVWRRKDTLPDGWRPDKSGILLTLIKADETETEKYGTAALQLELIAGPRAILQPFVVELIAENVRRRMPLYVSLYAPGQPRLKTFLNDHLDTAVARRDEQAIQGALMDILEHQTRERSRLT